MFDPWALLTCCLNFSRGTEHAHVTSNLAHVLHRVQLIGKMSLDKFESANDSDKYQKCEAKNKAKKTTWYTLTQEAFLKYFGMVISFEPRISSWFFFFLLVQFPYQHLNLILQQEIKAAKEEARDAYFEKELDNNANAPGVKAAMNKGAARCHQELKSKFTKLVGIADPELTPDFLEEIKSHYAQNPKPEMHQEKLYHVVTSQVDASEKVRWLKIWNGKQMERDAEGFPDDPTDASLDWWLHRQTFWYQVKILTNLFF